MRWGDRLGLIFFTFSTVVAILAAIDKPSLLAWLVAPHNAILATLYIIRNKETKSNRTGLWLGLIASILPIVSFPESIHPALLVVGLLGYALIIWSLVVLGKSFGIAPADRGLVTKAPYNFVRHPMYLGELVYRCALVGATFSAFNVTLLTALIAIQLMRIDMEENIITGYTEYQTQTRWRLVPGIW